MWYYSSYFEIDFSSYIWTGSWSIFQYFTNFLQQTTYFNYQALHWYICISMHQFKLIIITSTKEISTHSQRLQMLLASSLLTVNRYLLLGYDSYNKELVIKNNLFHGVIFTIYQLSMSTFINQNKIKQN